MKKLIFSASVFVILCVSITFLLNIANKPSQIAKATNEEKQIISSNVYIVKEYKNRIAVFEEEKDEPFKITEVFIDCLPAGDRKLLKKGIKVTTFEELSKILEDYEC